MLWRIRGLNAEALAAAAAGFVLGILIFEEGFEALAHIVHLGAVEIGQTVGRDDHFHALLLVVFVLGLDLVGIVEHVRIPGAPGFFHTYPQSLALAAADQGCLHMFSGRWGQRYGHETTSHTYCI